MLDWEQHRKELKKTGATIELMAEAAFVEFMRRLKAAGYDNPRDILADIWLALVPITRRNLQPQ